ncbi:MULTISPECIES: hypothetical protein [unclassified Pseudomonas]|jgi:cell division protein FtsB|uniref:hypothetical protein n=1 Tax=unclassified Pseudomonas TaxID=196821 RepID=UPI0021145C33|nr:MULTISPECIES: hypothetical protein [unclassified Pseudomonas]
MSNYEKLKELAEAASEGAWVQDAFEVVSDGIEDRRVARCSWLTDAQFIAAANPAAVLALIAENERLQQREQDLSASVKYWFNACGGKQFEAGVKHADEAASKYIDEHWRRQRDQLRAENAGLRTGYEAYEQVNAELKAEVEGLNDEYDKAWRHDLNDKKNVQVLAAELARLSAENEALRKDAGRYRWLRRAGNTKAIALVAEHCLDTLDEAIDAALGQGGESNECS